MTDDGASDQNVPYWYTDADRQDQLRRLSLACGRIADLFDRHEPGQANGYRTVAAAAASITMGSLDPRTLREFSRRLPSAPPWLHPKYADFNGPREAWQEEVAERRYEAESAALELRAVATYDR